MFSEDIYKHMKYDVLNHNFLIMYKDGVQSLLNHIKTQYMHFYESGHSTEEYSKAVLELLQSELYISKLDREYLINSFNKLLLLS